MSPRSRRRGAADIAMLPRCPKCLVLHFAWQKSVGPNVRYGSKADIGTQPRDVRFGSKADMATSQRNFRYSPKSRHSSARAQVALAECVKPKSLLLYFVTVSLISSRSFSSFLMKSALAKVPCRL